MSANLRPEGRESTHDPLCGNLLVANGAGHFIILQGDECYGCSVCDLIAKARADEREKAVQRVEAIELVTARPDGFLVYLDAAIAAARGEA